tara:strand:- start:313 stop:882 length:570 start_codon:yes stop_codon:yes gene_type:complete
MGVPLINPFGDDTNSKKTNSDKTSGGGKKTSSSSKPSRRGENIELMPQRDIGTAADAIAKKSSEQAAKFNPGEMPFRNDDANYIYKTSNGEPRKTNESTAQDKISKMFEESYLPEGDSFFQMGYSLRKAVEQKRQEKAEKAGFDNIADYKSAMKEGRQVNRANRRQERKSETLDKRAPKKRKRAQRRTY